jgi:hypothetical protein
MKTCSNKHCNTQHESKFKLCDTCRDYSRSNRRQNGNYKTARIINICEANGKVGGYGEILKLIERKYHA